MCRYSCRCGRCSEQGHQSPCLMGSHSSEQRCSISNAVRNRSGLRRVSALWKTEASVRFEHLGQGSPCMVVFSKGLKEGREQA